MHFNHLEEPPYPNWSDAIYLAAYPCGYAGMLLLLRSRLRPFRASLWLDGAVGGLTLAALTTALLFGPALSATKGDAATVAVTLAYPSPTCCCFAAPGSGSGSRAGARAVRGASSSPGSCSPRSATRSTPTW